MVTPTPHTHTHKLLYGVPDIFSTHSVTRTPHKFSGHIIYRYGTLIYIYICISIYGDGYFGGIIIILYSFFISIFFTFSQLADSAKMRYPLFICIGHWRIIFFFLRTYSAIRPSNSSETRIPWLNNRRTIEDAFVSANIIYTYTYTYLSISIYTPIYIYIPNNR